ncbi:hypothetical protein PFICI_05553 [Pestalotiopsis fici W106-1]|uniref:Peptidase C15, pyroglutamyl peptidase I-like protein n=1 Tax=Pestalotiopsis fici (strain W106-1 / CGMCC3.15140) TaxID=1229662 RepID=W3XE30_PESFW|nr:uncharacterized protein PFICI_05553 [Pestalotiopsis fici W106-1]ETS83677.1 hypothetical protein PFICI_05553 [Pestalotiopsis fici W106-1]
MTKTRDINVLITGMGPYPDGRGGRINPNTSHVVTTVLPKTLEPNTPRNPSAARIHITTLPEPVKTEYGHVRAFCRDLHARHAAADDDVDLFIHLGEARGWTWVTVERAAYGQGMSSSWWALWDRDAYYTIPDDAGQTIRDVGPSPWAGRVPLGLHPSFNVDGVCEGATALLDTLYRFGSGGSSSSRPGNVDAGNASDTFSSSSSHVQGMDNGKTVSTTNKPIEIRPHAEGGPYLCGFINYESLANRYVLNLKPNVLFCHVPGESDPTSLRRTADGLLAIVVAAVAQLQRTTTRE